MPQGVYHNHLLHLRLAQLMSHPENAKSLRSAQSLLQAATNVSRGADAVKIYANNQWVVLTAAMALKEALELLEISEEDARDPVKLKTAYRAVSRKNHPDVGGDVVKMQKINEAVAIAERLASTSSKSAPRTDAEREADRAAQNASDMERGTRNAALVKESLEKTFQPEVFTKWFEKNLGQPFTFKENVRETKAFSGAPMMYRNTCEWTSEDGETIFSLEMSIHYFDIKEVKSLGAPDKVPNLAFNVTLLQETLYKGRKSKMKPRDWGSSSRVATLMDPSDLWPAAKLKKMMSGKDLARKFSKRDMELGIEKFLGGRVVVNGKVVHAEIPLGAPNEKGEWRESSIKPAFHDRVVMSLQRATWGGWGAKDSLANWGLYTIAGPQVPKAGREVATNVKYTSYPESDAFLAALRKASKAVANETDVNKIASTVIRILNEIKEPPAEAPPKKPAPAPIDFGMGASVRAHIKAAMALLEKADRLK